MNRKILCIGIILLLSSMQLAAKEPEQRETFIAKVGDNFITEREFVNRFELQPGIGRRPSQMETAKAEFLYSMIAEKLLAQNAIARGLDRDSVVQQSLMTIRKKLSRDELYRVEISAKVKLTDVEIIRGMARARLMPMTSYLFFENENDARFIRQQRKTSRDFESLRIDSTYHAFRDTATVIWGDAEPELEDAVYGVNAGSISPVIKAGNGYYIVKVVKVLPNTAFSSMQPNVLRDRVVDILRLRKERKRLDEYVEEVLRDKRGYSVPGSFLRLARTLRDVYCRGGVEYRGLFANEVMDEVRRRLSAHLNDSLTVVGSSVWTVGDVTEKLTNKQLKPEEAIDSSRIAGILNTQIRVLVQQELLEQEALRRGLDQSPGVREKVQIWKDAMLASQMTSVIQESLTANEVEVVAAMKDLGTDIPMPQVNIRQLVTTSLPDMNAAVSALREGMKFEEAVARWSIDTLTRQRGGETGFFPITKQPIVGEAAWKMTVGQVYGPVSIPGRFVLFTLLAKKNFPEKGDTAFASKYEQAKSRYLSLKFKNELNHLLADQAEKRGFAVFGDRLKKIEVTSIPMMTFRILGFGGRLFEMPFVEPRLDWLGIDPSKSNQLP
ncbi:MAG TPA: peptidylprolyl isomerase [Bacteroidota bacterium]|nr:peptidylprolyl isomerase [Bacteroidota bacterium]